MIVGGRVTQLSAKKLNDGAKMSGLNINMNITGVEAEKNMVKVSYAVVTTYSPDIAEIEVKGELFLEEGEKKSREILDYYKKNKKLDTMLLEEVLTSINYSATAIGTLVSFALGIGAPLNIPKAKLDSNMKTGPTS